MKPCMRRNDKVREAIKQISREGGTMFLSAKEMADVLEKKVRVMYSKKSLSTRSVSKILGEFPFVESRRIGSNRFTKIGENA